MTKPISRLRWAWIALGAVLSAILLAALLAPGPRTAERGVRIALPSAPDGLAPLPGREREDAPAEPAEPDDLLPTVLRGEGAARLAAPAEPEAGEVVITFSGEDARGAAAPVALATAIPPSAPRDELTARTEAGLRPARGPDGTAPFAAYRRLQPAGDGKAVAVVVSGLGLDRGLTTRALALPPAVSLGFAPYAKDLPGQVEAANAAGHEVLIELPMGAPGVPDAALGPAGLLATRTPAANAKRLDWVLTRAPAYPMVTNYLGEGFSRDEAGMSLVMDRLSRAGLAYLDDTGLARAAASEAGVPLAQADLLLAPGEALPAARLRGLLREAAPGEVALVKLYASEDTLSAVDQWVAALPSDVALVPASTAVKAP